MTNNENVSLMTLLVGIAIGVCIGLALAPKPEKHSDDVRSTRARFETVTAAGVLFCIDKTSGETWMMCSRGRLYEGWGYLGAPQNPIEEEAVKQLQKLTPPAPSDANDPYAGLGTEEKKPWEEDWNSEGKVTSDSTPSTP